MRPWEIWHLRSDNAKLYRAIGQPSKRTSLETSLRKVLDYFNASGRQWGF
jgi:hypothetical protein